jgi:hypothetical protein
MRKWKLSEVNTFKDQSAGGSLLRHHRAREQSVVWGEMSTIDYALRQIPV